jgi:hypothetical protein
MAPEASADPSRVIGLTVGGRAPVTRLRPLEGMVTDVRRGPGCERLGRWRMSTGHRDANEQDTGDVRRSGLCARTGR